MLSSAAAAPGCLITAEGFSTTAKLSPFINFLYLLIAGSCFEHLFATSTFRSSMRAQGKHQKWVHSSLQAAGKQPKRSSSMPKAKRNSVRFVLLMAQPQQHSSAMESDTQSVDQLETALSPSIIAAESAK